MDQGESSLQHQQQQQQKQQLQPQPQPPPPPQSLPSASASASSSVSSPCAACKLLRRRCARDCVFAPFFPPDEPHKFVCVHRIFGASNVSKMLQELPFDRRADAVSSLVYEAHARIRDPVYGSAGTISFLKAQVEILQKQVLWLQAELIALRLRISQLMEPSAMACTQTQTQTQAAEDHPPPSPPLPPPPPPPPPPSSSARSLPFYSDDNHNPWN